MIARESESSARVVSLPVNSPTQPLSRIQRERLYVVTLVISDMLMLGLAFLLSYILRFEILPYGGPIDLVTYSRIVVGLLPALLLIFAVFQLYNPHYLFGGLKEYIQVFNAVTCGAVVVMGYSFFLREDILVSRGWLGIAWAFGLILVGGERFALRRVLYALRRRGHLLSPTVIVGANAEGKALAEQLRDWRTSGLYIAGFCDDDCLPGVVVENGFHNLGGLEDLEQIVKERGVEEIIIAPTALSREQLLGLFRDFTTRPGVNLRFSTGLFEMMTTGVRVQELAYVPLIEINESRISGIDSVLKAALDYSLSLVGMIVALPVIGLLALWVRLDSPGPAIYRRRVMGVNGVAFDAFKLRTMHLNGEAILANYPEKLEELQREHKIKDDPRVTRAGRFIRKFSLDELPQVFNVLLGQMSLVGPRMISPPEMQEYGKWGMNLLTVKPGITGLWQVSGRSDVAYEERVRLDMYYIRNWTIWLDLYLLFFRTPMAVLKRKGAY